MKIGKHKAKRHVENMQKAWKIDMVNVILLSQLLQQNPEIWAKCLSLSPFQGAMESLWALFFVEWLRDRGTQTHILSHAVLTNVF